MPVRELYHFMQIVDDFDAAQAFADSLFAPENYISKSWSDFDKRWASLGVVGPDFVLEIMEPSAAAEDQGHPLPKFRARHGQHWHSFSWFVDPEDMPALISRLEAFGVRVIMPYPPEEGRPLTIFTHPKDTFGQLEIQEMGETGGDPRFPPGFSAARWLEGPLGLERMSHLTTVVADVERARSFYETCLEAKTFHTRSTPDSERVFTLVGNETVVELAQPTSGDSDLARDLAAHGELPHAATFKVADIARAAGHVRGLGLSVVELDAETFALDPAQSFGAPIAFTQAELPGDPRL
jgi:predicted enzyme related to lactoylglutathione lyase